MLPKEIKGFIIDFLVCNGITKLIDLVKKVNLSYHTVKYNADMLSDKKVLCKTHVDNNIAYYYNNFNQNIMNMSNNKQLDFEFDKLVNSIIEYDKRGGI